VLVSWFVAGLVLLIRAQPDHPVLPASAVEKEKSRKSKSNRQ
jgi:hypothetical protein